MSSALLDAESEILERAVGPLGTPLSRDAAESLLRIQFAASDVDRMNELAARSRQGDLSTEDKELLEAYERVGHLLSTLQSYARRALRRNGTN